MSNKTNQVPYSTCVKCGNNQFIAVDKEISGSDFLVIQCSNCGGIVSVMENTSTTTIVATLAKVMGKEKEFISSL